MEVTEGMLTLFKIWCQRDKYDDVRALINMLPKGEPIPGTCDRDYRAFAKAVDLSDKEVKAVIWHVWKKTQP